MSSKFLDTIEDHIKMPLFTDEDLRLVFRDKKASDIHNSVAYHLKKKNLVKYKRGLYSLSKTAGHQKSFSKFKLANKLVVHSFVSLESALSYHGFIPEAVYEITSASFLKNKTFENTLGRFSFTYSPVVPFYLGVEKDDVSAAKIANPIRALFDLVYSKRKKYHFVNELEDDLRLDLNELRQILKKFSVNDIISLGELYKKNTTRTLANTLIKEYK